MKYLLTLMILIALQYSANCQTGLSERQAKALLKLVKERSIVDSLLSSQENSINTLLEQENALFYALEAKKTAFDACSTALEAEGAKSENYIKIIEEDRKRIRRLKFQRYLIAGFGIALGYFVAR